MHHRSLEGRVAIVVGGASGIGEAIANRLATDGARVAIIDRVVPPDRISAHACDGLSQPALIADVTDRQALEDAFADVILREGRLDILVFSAGISMPSPFLDLSDQAWSDVVDVNLTGAFRTAQIAARHMVSRGAGGRIVFIASNCAQRAASSRANYNASKGGLISLMQSIATELAPSGILVNAVSPGPVDSPMSRRNHTPALRASILATTPMARYGLAEEVAGAVAFLVSDDSTYITGHELTVDGGCGAALYLYKD